MTAEILPKKDEILFLPLGGCGVFGANVTMYGSNGQWIMVDCGMAFADDTMPGVDVLLPDLSFAIENRKNLLGIVLTHAHEDHIGAIEYLWPELRCPIYATPFTAGLLRAKLSETPFAGKVEIIEIPVGGEITLKPFHIRYIRMAHSIPEAHALAITVRNCGTILHTGDWKMDDGPVVGHVTDTAALKALGDEGVLAMVCDSTNAMVPGHSGSEAKVQENLAELFGEFGRKIFVSCFASNVARIESIARAAEKNGRHVALLGRSLWRIQDVAFDTGYFKKNRRFLSDEEAEDIPPHKLVYICTGSQGEPRAMLTRIANDDHPKVQVDKGDTVIFSSRAIPGNERAIERVKNHLMMAGADIITDRDAPIHVSGHPYREELKQIYGLVRPQIAVPVHGERMQLEKHADLARGEGVPSVVVPQNGTVLRLWPGNPEKAGEVPHGMLAIEGKRIVAIDHQSILMRRRMMFHGSAVVTVVIDSQGELVADPKVSAIGLVDEDSEVDARWLEEAARAAKIAIREMPKPLRHDDGELSERVRIAVRKYFTQNFDKKPQTRVHLVRI